MPQNQQEWRLKEHVAGLLESGLAGTDARLALNVDMPRLDQPGHRQCDAIVRSGPAARETITLIEVQHRKARYGEHHLADHLEKMRQIGAHRLVVVSTAGFAKSVVQRAARLGPTVQLMLLRDLEHGTWPIGIDPNQTALTVTEVLLKKVAFLQPVLPLGSVKLAECHFEAVGDPVLRNFQDLSTASLLSHLADRRIREGRHACILRSSTPQTGWMYRSHEHRCEYSIEMLIEFTVESKTVPLFGQGYSPAPQGGDPMGWVLSADTPDRSRMDLILTLADDQRSYRASAIVTGQNLLQLEMGEGLISSWLPSMNMQTWTAHS